LRFVTFNVQHGRRPDGVVDVTALTAACMRLEADVLALQEVDVGMRRSGRVDQVAAVAEATGMRCVFGPASPQYGNALLVRGDIDDVDVIPLPHAENREPRSAIVARASVDGGSVSVACCHLGVHGDAVPQLPAVLHALVQRPAPRALLGDLNLERVDVTPLVAVKGEATFPAHRPRRRIDHIALDRLTPSRVEVLHRQPVSDHRPLLVEAV
jgi:endonuclease/exonuclease/phosphatase family metal-dependent hydrolase